MLLSCRYFYFTDITWSVSILFLRNFKSGFFFQSHPILTVMASAILSFLYFHKVQFSQIKFCTSKFCQEDLILPSIFLANNKFYHGLLHCCQDYFLAISSTSNSHYEFDKRKIACICNLWENCQQFWETEIKAKSRIWKGDRRQEETPTRR